MSERKSQLGATSLPQPLMFLFYDELRELSFRFRVLGKPWYLVKFGDI